MLIVSLTLLLVRDISTVQRLCIEYIILRLFLALGPTVICSCLINLYVVQGVTVCKIRPFNTDVLIHIGMRAIQRHS